MAASNAEETKELRELFSKAKIKDDLTQWLIAEKSMESVSDFYGYFTSKGYEEEIDLLLQTNDTFKDKQIITSRLRAAWRAADHLEKERKAEKSQVGPTNQELDLPLSDSVKDELDKAWTIRYNIEVHLRLMPPASLVARKYREIKKNAHEVDDIRRVRSLFLTTKPQETRREALGKNLIVETGEQLDVVIRGCIDYYWGVRILATAWAKAGNHQVDSVQRKGEKIQYSDLSENLDYADDCLRYSSEKSLPASEALRWLEEIDSLTRATMTHYMRRGWPQVEALGQARREHAIDWRAVPSKRSRSPETPQALDRNPKVVKTAGHLNGKEICKPFNDARGCAKSPQQCPLQRLHVCDAVGADGVLCGSKTHSRAQHR